MNGISRTNYPVEDGYELWLRYRPIEDKALLGVYRELSERVLVVSVPTGSPALAAARDELERGLSGMLGLTGEAFLPEGRTDAAASNLIVGTPLSCAAIADFAFGDKLTAVGKEGFIIARRTVDGRAVTVIAANEDIGALYGVFRFLRMMQTRHDLVSRRDAPDFEIADSPRIALRMLDHWDNLNRSVERGYAGHSLWDWHKLPDYVSPRYRDYARANASLGINGAALTNVNANALVLTEEYLLKAAAIADVFRPYGIRVFLTARFTAPVELGDLQTADPLDPGVIEWWRKKANEIYGLIPDFGGFLVKANSEGQPGPQKYGRDHADGANLLAGALAPRGGTVIWRAFVYSSEVPEDRAKQAYSEFEPLDGKFLPNVFVQVKNGPIDFQPREPFHPLFGAMPRTPLMMEFQITQEYLGFATHLAYLGTLFKETLDSDTFCPGPGSTVGSVVDGGARSGMAAVSNIGDERNWCGHPFAQANWYAYGRLAWDHRLEADAIAEEWIRMTFSNESSAVHTMREMMANSREAIVNYMTPLGLHHIMGWDHHYGPAPWIDQGRPDWTSVYFHRAAPDGIGFERGPQGSDAVAQYRSPLKEIYGDAATCPEDLLLWFHHVPWNRKMKSGRILWDELCLKYQAGVETVRGMRDAWHTLKGAIDRDRHEHVAALLDIQEKEAVWWRDACLSYFAAFSGKPLPKGVEKPGRTLEEYKAIQKRFVPGIGGTN